MKKNNYRFLNIRGAVLDNYQLQSYMEKIAITHDVQNRSNKNTYPISRLKDNFNFINKTYQLLNEHIKLGIDIYPAGEWFLDNLYIIEETVKTVINEMTLKKYTSFPGIANGTYEGYSRDYVLASEIVAYTDNKINDDVLKLAISMYQRRKTLSMSEIWNLWIFLEIAIIENVRHIAEKIYASQLQKYKVENIIERILEKKEKNYQKFKPIKDQYQREVSYKEMKYPFIEYMSYKLKKYGKKGIPYLTVLEEEVRKMGMNISEVIEKEHYDIAISKVSLGNSITSIKEILRIDFVNLFEEINGVEEILNKDPSKVYTNMDYKTKEYYRNKIKEISEKTKISEIYIANKALELSSKWQIETKESHIGYYLISKGYQNLIDNLGIKNKKILSLKQKANKYIVTIFIFTILLSVLFAIFSNIVLLNPRLSIIIGIVSIIPICEIWIQLINYILNKTIKPKIIPKLDFSKGVPKECKTFVVIPTILKEPSKIKELFEKLEIYYLANKSENIYFALLGDATASKNERENTDEEIVKIGLEEIKKLNQKYGNNGTDKEDELSKFHFLYRKRKWNPSEECYLGWERKRGLLCEFNDFLINGTNDFLINTIALFLEKNKVINIKYVITLDADTNLVLESGIELIGAMAHILNFPKIDKNKNIVVEGHGLIQPKIGIDLVSSKKSLFTEIYAEVGGIDSYSNANSDIYQDNFDEGIFTGKGIYDLKTFNSILKNEIPENTVLSHDLLEGNYLRCGLATDILLLDGYPSKYNSYISRFERWIRGDWQIYKWIKNEIAIKNGNKRTNPFNRLSKFKILDNLRRSLNPIFISILIVLASILRIFKEIKTYPIVILAIISYIFPTILDFLNMVIFKKNISKDSVLAHKNIVPVMGNISRSFLRAVLNISLLPYTTYVSLIAIIKTIYRMNVSRKHLLEWTTSEDAEKNAKTDLTSYYKNMWINVVSSILAIIFFGFTKSIISIILFALWAVAPLILNLISKNKEDKNLSKTNKISKEEREYILEIGERTWKFFKDNINEENNFLPPDNYQEDRINKIARKNFSYKYWTRIIISNF